MSINLKNNLIENQARKWWANFWNCKALSSSYISLADILISRIVPTKFKLCNQKILNLIHVIYLHYIEHFHWSLQIDLIALSWGIPWPCSYLLTCPFLHSMQFNEQKERSEKPHESCEKNLTWGLLNDDSSLVFL